MIISTAEVRPGKNTLHIYIRIYFFLFGACAQERGEYCLALPRYVQEKKGFAAQKSLLAILNFFLVRVCSRERE